ncbi:MAG: Tm-1-like ATP-binding domain-containing protein [Deltaproteobacteria bacterium]|jgi:uncharacterized protein (UPF0261 family)|nr:Tm-1-like ATP-binding domain-containing protein [Deltaproteobacteria bacterium]
MTESIMKKIVAIGTLDTRGEEIRHLADRIEDNGFEPLVMDVGVLGAVPFEPFITRDSVARAAGTSIQEIIALRHEGKAMSAMAAGCGKILADLHEQGQVQGVIAAGGSMSTSLALEAMKVLPMGLPKLILSTIAFSPLINPESVCADLAMMLWPGGLYGLNTISRRVLDSAAGAISGSAKAYIRQVKTTRKVVGITSLGTSQLKYVEILKPALEKKGYEVAVFHTTGMGGKAFEEAVSAGLVDVALDLSLVELVDYINGGATTSGKYRLKAAAEKGIPQIVGAGAIGHFFWFSGRPLPPEFKNRKHHRHNQLLTIVVSDREDKAKVGKLVAERLNLAKGPTTLVVPMTGWIEGDRHPKSPFHDPKGGTAFLEALKTHLNPGIRVIPLDGHVNDSIFCDTVLQLFDEMTAERTLS